MKARWYQYFEKCKDKYNYCADNTASLALSMDTEKVTDAMDEGQEATFTMRLDAGSTTQAKKIPQNTFCSWKVDLNMRAVYVLEVTRDAGATKEIMGLKITGARKVEYVEDF